MFHILGKYAMATISQFVKSVLHTSSNISLISQIRNTEWFWEQNLNWFQDFIIHNDPGSKSLHNILIYVSANISLQKPA